MNVALGLLSVGLLVAFIAIWRAWRRSVRADYIRNLRFPPGIFDKLSLKHPQLSPKDRQLVAQGLRQFFLAYLQGGCRFVSMPSQVADDLWHEFILYTRHYALFCERAFGQFLHHTPAIVLGRNHRDNTGLRRVWWYCCKQEGIDPRRALRLPLLFALDGKLAIAGGFAYVPDCRSLVERNSGSGDGSAHCGGDMGDSSFDGTTDGLGDGDGDGGGGGGGDGCGGGGCGGGD